MSAEPSWFATRAALLSRTHVASNNVPCLRHRRCRRRDPPVDGARSEPHVAFGRLGGGGTPKPPNQPDAGRLVQPQPYRPRLAVLRRAVARRAPLARRTALPCRASDRGEL